MWVGFIFGQFDFLNDIEVYENRDNILCGQEFKLIFNICVSWDWG